MGLSCKPFGKMQSILRKIENEQKRESEALKAAKKKKSKKEESET